MKNPYNYIICSIGLCITSLSALAQKPTQAPIDPQRLSYVRTYESYAYKTTAEIEQYKVEVEKAKARQLQYRAQNDERSAKGMDSVIRQYTGALARKQQELTMYNQAITGYKAARSTVPAVASAQDSIVALTLQKAQVAIQQTQATQSGNQAEALRLGQQVKQLQAQIAAKQQEIRLMELQAKTGRY